MPKIFGWVLAASTVAFFIAGRKININLGRASRYAAFFVLMLAYALVSVIWVINKSESFGVFVYQFTGIGAAIFITAVIRNFDDLKLFLRILTVCYVVIVALSVFEIYTGIFLFQPSNLAFTLRDSYGLHFPYTVFYNTNDNASFLTMFAPFAIYTLMDWVGGLFGKVIGTTVSVLAFFALICGRARNCFITIICFMAVLLILCIVKKNFRKFATMVAVILASLPLSLVLIKLTALKANSIFSKINTISVSDHSISQRLEMTVAGFRMAAAYYFMGVGVGNSVPLMPYYSTLAPINLHDMPLQIFVEYGIIIFGLYVLVTVFMARDFLKYRAHADNWQFFSLLCFLTLLAFQSVGLQSSDAMHILALWMLFGIWFSAVKLFYSKNETQ